MNLTYKVAALLFKEWLLGSIASQVTAPATRLWQGFSSKVTLVLRQHFAAAWLTFELRCVHPVNDVESVVDSKSEETVRGDGLGHLRAAAGWPPTPGRWTRSRGSPSRRYRGNWIIQRAEILF